MVWIPFSFIIWTYWNGENVFDNSGDKVKWYHIKIKLVLKSIPDEGLHTNPQTDC